MQDKQAACCLSFRWVEFHLTLSRNFVYTFDDNDNKIDKNIYLHIYSHTLYTSLFFYQLL